MLPKLGAAMTIVLPVMVLTLGGQTVPPGELLKNSTQSTGKAIPLSKLLTPIWKASKKHVLM
jgi:hypothetical protein